MNRTSVNANNSGVMRGGMLFVTNDDPDVNTVAAFHPDRVTGWREVTNNYFIEVFLDSGHTIGIVFVGDSLDDRFEALDEFRQALVDLGPAKADQ